MVQYPFNGLFFFSRRTILQNSAVSCDELLRNVRIYVILSGEKSLINNTIYTHDSLYIYSYNNRGKKS